jgi:predicted ATPase
MGGRAMVGAGTRLGSYEIVAEICRGGMGTVYRGIDRETGQTVAIKHLKPELVASDPDMIERFNREGAALRQLDHPNIVKMLGTVEEGDNHYLVLEYLSGGSLDDLLQEEPRLPINMVLKISLELADALTRAHHVKIIHRDIKPSNVLIAEDGTPRLTDFGVAYIGSKIHITHSGFAVGTPQYFSPEAINGEEIDSRSDIWAFGVMLFKMLTGKMPFEGEKIVGLLNAILTKPVPDLETLRADAPVALVDLVYRMLEKDRNARIPSVRQVGAELEAILEGKMTTRPEGIRLEMGRFVTPQPKSSEEVKKYNFPSQVTPFVGREKDLTDLAKLLEDPQIRLVTILGPGGMGKTRLALEMAKRHANQFSGGIVFVSLASLNSSEGLVQRVAESVSYHFQGGERSPQQQILDYLSKKEYLLVLDNFEDALDQAPIVSEILQAASKTKIIITSRERLSLSEESIFQIHGMDIPESLSVKNASDYDAVQLFFQSARRANPEFKLGEEELKYILHICHVVEGLPLGILLAAAWVRTLSLQEVADEINRSLDFLESDLRNIPDRHRSIHVIFDSSWKRLSDEEQQIFMKLSVFEGGFSREAGQKVTGASLRTLGSLVDKSFIRRAPDTGRFQIHELLRHYARNQLKVSHDTESVFETHAAYFANFMEAHWVPMTDRRQKIALQEVKADIENSRAAWRYWIQKGKVEEIRKFLRTFWITYDICGWYPTGIELFEQGIKTLQSINTDDAKAALGWIFAAEGLYKVVSGCPREGFMLAEKALQVLKPLNRSEEREMALISLFFTSGSVNQQEVSIQAANDCIQVATEIGDYWGIGVAKEWLALTAIHRKDFEEARRLANEALQIFIERGDRRSESILCTEVLGLLAITLQKYEEARAWVQKGIQAAEEIDFTYSLQTGYYQLGYIALLQENLSEAGKFWEKATRIGEGISPLFEFGFSPTNMPFPHA